MDLRGVVGVLGVVGVAEGLLLVKKLTEVLGKLVFAFRLHHLQERFNHRVFFLICLLLEVSSFGYLQKGLLVGRVVLSKIFIEPYFNLP